MSDVVTVRKRLGPFADDFGDISLGRIIIFMVTCLGCLTVLEGNYLILYETLWQVAPRTTNGLSVITLGAGLITVAMGLKGWQRMSEAKIASLPISNASPPVLAEAGKEG